MPNELPEFNPEEVEEVMDNSEELGESKYEFELFLSTDGKHTIHVKAFDAPGKRKALRVATETYNYILTRYGTKQAQVVKEYGKENGEIKPDQEICKHTNVKFSQSHTEKNPGKWFKSCTDCGKFMGWM